MSESIKDLLNKTPAWVSVPPHRWSQEGQALSEEISTLFSQIAEFDTSEVRKGIEQFMALNRSQGSLSVEAMGTLFLLNRYLFAVSETTDISIGFFGGFLGVPVEDRTVGALWPWRMSAGVLELASPFQGYAGDDYLALEEFDAFDQKFGRR